MPAKIRIVRLTPATAERFFAKRKATRDYAARAAAQIVADVRRRGDRAVAEYTEKFDGISLRPRDFFVSKAEVATARREAPPELLAAIQHAARNIRRVAEQQLPKPWRIQVEPGVEIAQRVTPIESVACYIPGGRHALVSSLLMTVIPAQIAGVPRIVVACPKPNAAVLCAAHLLGVSEMLRIGGAQAIAALAYGTRTIRRVDKIVGPGSRWVDAAKRIVSHDCAVDLPAGPTELLVIASRGNPDSIAADMLAQSEHGTDSVATLVTTSRPLASQVAQAIEARLADLPAANPAKQNLQRPGTIFLARNESAAFDFANRFAPEHLSLPDRAAVPKEIRAAGSIFLGAHTAQSLGDYATGSNHVLPTSGWAHVRGGLSVSDFVKCTTVQQVSAKGFARLAPVAATLARAEGLHAHERAATSRAGAAR